MTTNRTKTLGKLVLVCLIVALGFIVGSVLTSAGQGVYKLIADRLNPPPPPVTSYSDTQLCAQSKTLADKIEAFQQSATIAYTQLEDQLQAAYSNATSQGQRNQLFYQQGSAYTQLNSQETYQWRSTLLPEAVNLRDELLQRIPTSSVPTSTGGTMREPVYDLIAFEGNLAGPNPVGDVAVYLQELAKILCP